MLLRVPGLVHAGWSDSAAEGVRAHRVRARRVDTAEFVRDWSNHVRGDVIGPDGRPIPGTQVDVFAKMDLLAAVSGAPSAAPETVATIADDGSFDVAGLPYGNKYLRARAPGYLDGVAEDVLSLDGVGVQSLILTLAPAAEWSVTLLSASGEPAVGLPVRIVPEGLSELPSASTSDAQGRVGLPNHLLGEAGFGARLVVGEPGVTFSVERGHRSLTLPEAAPLVLACAGVAPDEPVLVRCLPRESPRFGAWNVEFERAGEGPLVVPNVWKGVYAVAVEQGGRAAWVETVHTGEPIECQLADRWSTRVRFVDDGGAPVPGAVEWKWQPSRPRALADAAADRKSLLEQADPLVREGRIAEGTELALSGLPPTGGWLSAWSIARGRKLVRLEQGRAEQEVALSGEPVSIRTHLPFLPVLVETAQGWTATYEADAFAEVRVLLPAGPFVARSRFSRGGGSRPRGSWAGIDVPPIRFNLSDLWRGAEGMSVFGFVHANGRPVAGAEVFLADSRSRKEVADEAGFYCFDGVDTPSVHISARPEGARDAVLWSSVAATDARRGGARVDLELWPGAIRLDACPDRLEGESIALVHVEETDVDVSGEPSDGAATAPRRMFLRTARVSGGSIGFTVLRPGAYELWGGYGSDEVVLEGRFTIRGGGADPAQEEW